MLSEQEIEKKIEEINEKYDTPKCILRSPASVVSRYMNSADDTIEMLKEQIAERDKIIKEHGKLSEKPGISKDNRIEAFRHSANLYPDHWLSAIEKLDTKNAGLHKEIESLKKELVELQGYHLSQRKISDSFMLKSDSLFKELESTKRERDKYKLAFEDYRSAYFQKECDKLDKQLKKREVNEKNC